MTKRTPWIMALPDQFVPLAYAPRYVVGVTEDAGWGWDTSLLHEAVSWLDREGAEGPFAYYFDPLHPAALIVAPETWGGRGPVVLVAPWIHAPDYRMALPFDLQDAEMNGSKTVALAREVSLLA